MNIHLQNAGKKFNREWIFRKLNYQFISTQTYAITGPNGSGKSTLLQCIAGSTDLSEGNIQVENGEWELRNKKQENNSQSFSIAAPYLELIEEMTATEFLQFHQSFQSFFQQSFSEVD